HRVVAKSVAAATMIASMLIPSLAHAQMDADEPLLEFRPHCEEQEAEACPSFDVRDPESLQTERLSVGSELDIDLVLRNPTQEQISRFRAWIAYDPSVLTGIDITVPPEFPLPTPGE